MYCAAKIGNFRIMNWTNEQVLALIGLYRSRNVLWGSKNPFYKDKNKRHDAFMKIAHELNADKTEIEKKNRYLQSHFSRELKKVKTRNSGDRLEDVYTSSWFVLKSMMFLADKNKPKETQDTEESQEESEVENEEIDYNEERSDNTNTATFAEKDVITPSTSEKRKFLSTKQNSSVSKKPKTEDAVSGAYSILKHIHESRQARDEYTLVGEEVAAQLRKLPTKYSKIVAHQIISITLFEARLGKYNAPTSSFSPMPSVSNLNISTTQ
ncbi:uncharacterized protein [Leptinotarsa decemlineata]|uniref:uncharacterized protein n=1 Tax=Leptinotarsa decemlineata TaxID=7539 RepID=UPI003D30B8F6